MLAARLHDIGDLRIDDIPRPDLPPDHVRIGVAVAELGGDSTLELTLQRGRRSGRLPREAVYDDGAHFPLNLARDRQVAVLHPTTGSGGYSASSIVEAVSVSASQQLHNAINPPQVFRDLAWGETKEVA